MKRCGGCNWEWPDNVDTCSVCGNQEFIDPSTAKLQRPVRQLPSCCSNAECASLMFFNGAKYCSECGRNLQPVSWKAWEEKVVYPALQKDISGVAFDPSQLLQSASKMGFIPEEAESHFNNLFKQATNVSRDEFYAWLQESVLPFQDDENGSAAAARQALDDAKRLKISKTYAERVLSQVTSRVDVLSGSLESYTASERLGDSSGTPQPTTSLDHDLQVEMFGADKVFVDPLRNSAKSFYRRLVAGGSVTNNLIYLDFKKSASKDGLRNTEEFLKECSPQGAFVLFVSSENQGWVFPNPKLIFTPDSLKPLFPTLTADQFNNFKEHIEPVPVIRIRKDRWQVQPADNRSHDSQGNNATATGPKTTEPLKSALVFPVSVADCLAKMQSSSEVVRHDLVRDILVTGPDGKGELALIHHSGISKKTESLLAVPRITRFQSTDAFYLFYDKYYECAKPSAGVVWIIKPALVSKVQGGWQLKEKGVLEIDWVRKQERPAVLDVEPDINENDEEQAPEEYSLPRPVPQLRSRFVIGIIASLVLLAALVMGIWRSPQPPTANNNASPTPGPPVNMVPIQGGAFQMGNDAGDEYEKPAHRVVVKPFLMDTYEVTCEEYLKFVNAKSHRAPSNWIGGQYPTGAAKKPVTGVDWDDATAYARWAEKRLPTEEEWEFAARGTDSRRYPWGNDWQPRAANADGASKGLADVGTYKGASPAQAYDMVGNAWEWTASPLAPYPGGRLPDKPSGDLKVLRGGSWQSNKDSATTTYRYGWPARAGKDYSNTGLRCAKDVSEEPSR